MRRYELREGWTLTDESGAYCYSTSVPAQVHDVLLDNGVIENPNITGINKDTWIGEREWVYAKEFDLPEEVGEWVLKIGGIDTYADIVLNGEKIGENRSAYQSLTIRDVPLQKTNRLEVRVYPPRERSAQQKVDPVYADKIPDYNQDRIFRSGYQDYCGPLPFLVRMGIYGQVCLENVKDGAFESAVIGTDLNSRLDEGTIHADLTYEGDLTGCSLAWSLLDEGETVQQGSLEISGALDILIENPKLWFPRTHGTPHVYTFVLQLMRGGETIDTARRQIGFRHVYQKDPNLHFEINHVPVRMYGACLVHPDTVTGCQERTMDKLKGLLDLAEMGHFNAFRIWGESEIFDEAFYEECDRRGFLIWQDFYLGWGMYNEIDEMLPIYRSEAEELVKRLKHHPSILLWCGGNENYWSTDWIYPGAYCSGEKIFAQIYPDVVKQFDPLRYYHVNSPAGGEYANDPLGGDTHGYTHLWFVPGRLYPEFLSENCRVSAPEMKSMERMMTPEELWPEGYVNLFTKRNPISWPKSWAEHNTNLGHLKLGPVENYPDAESAPELVYRLGEAHSEYIRGQVEGFRRGRPAEDLFGRRRCGGHLLWRFNNNSNIISFGVVDYFNEPLRAYYALKRTYEPFQISFDIGDKIGIWAVNDTCADVHAKAVISRLDLDTNQVLQSKEVLFTCARDESRVIADLNSFGQFLKNSVLYVQVFTLEGELITQTCVFPQPERWMRFPRTGKIRAWMEDGVLCLETDTFARSVELLGDEDGDAFGWMFEDNYFDLIPGIVKKVRILGRHKKGSIRVSPYYWEPEDAVDVTF